MQNIFKFCQKIMAILLVILLVVTSNITSFPAPAWGAENTIMKRYNNKCRLNNNGVDNQILIEEISYVPVGIATENLEITYQENEKEDSVIDSIAAIGQFLRSIGEIILDIVYLIKAIQSIFGNQDQNPTNPNITNDSIYNYNDRIIELNVIPSLVEI